VPSYLGTSACWGESTGR